MTATDVLTFAEVEAFDPHHPRNPHGENRACCPRCGDSKPVDAGHRCLKYHGETGLYHCYRCPIKGQFREFWEAKNAPPKNQQPRYQRRDKKAEAVAAFLSYNPSTRPRSVPPSLVPVDPVPDFRKRLGKYQPVAESPAAVAYLAGRGFDLSDSDTAELFHASRVQYGKNFMVSPSSFGFEAIIFPMIDSAGKAIATNGRLLHPNSTQPKAYSLGRKSEAVFMTPGALDGSAIVIVEAPFDALALALCGVPAVALAGTNPIPAWLFTVARGKTVLFAFDADEAGDTGSKKHAQDFHKEGAARVHRWTPVGAKDWNEYLLKFGRESMRLETRNKTQYFPHVAAPDPPLSSAGPDIECIPAEILHIGEEVHGDISIATHVLERVQMAQRMIIAMMRDAKRNKLPKPLPADIAAPLPSGRGKKLGKSRIDPNPLVCGAANNHDFAREMQERSDSADDMQNLAYWQSIGDREISDLCYLATCYNADGGSWLPLPKVHPDLLTAVSVYLSTQGGTLDTLPGTQIAANSLQ